MRVPTATALVLLVTAAVVASAEDDLTSLSYISYVERYATVQPASQESNLEAITNMPVVAGDRIDTAREARIEVQLADTSTLWLDEYTSVSFDALANSRDTSSDRTVLFLAEGTIIVEIPAQALASEQTRIDGSAETVYLEPAGLYRLEADPDGGMRVEVWSGKAWVSTPEGGVQVTAGSAALVRAGRFDRVEGELSQGDELASWVELRRNPVEGDSMLFTDARYGRQAAVLDSYGTWVYVPDYDTWGWQPTVTSTWRPYTWGRWYWTPTGWSWISYEPWGWMPYHYGSWYFHASHGWMWFWDSSWGPAWVDWMWWPGHIGWCPRGFYSYHYWNSWHGHHHQPYQPNRPNPPQIQRPGAPREPGRSPGVLTSERPVDPSRFALDLRGRARLEQVDARGWNVVATDDFDSPHLGRRVRSGDQVLPGIGDEIAVVRSGPLLTDAPSREAPRVAIRDVFQAGDRPDAADISSILARRSDLDPAEANRLGRPTTTAVLASRGAGEVPVPGSTQGRLNESNSGASGGGSAAPVRATVRNVYRQNLPGDDELTGSRSTGGGLNPVRPGSTGRTVGSTGSGSMTLRPTDRSGSPYRTRADSATVTGATADRGLRGTVVSPTRGNTKPITVRGTSGSNLGGSSQPVIVPRTTSRSRLLGVNRSAGSRSSSSSRGTVSSTPTSRGSSGSRSPSVSSSSRSSGSRSSVSSSSSSSSHSSSSSSSSSRSSSSSSSSSSRSSSSSSKSSSSRR